MNDATPPKWWCRWWPRNAFPAFSASAADFESSAGGAVLAADAVLVAPDVAVFGADAELSDVDDVLGADDSPPLPHAATTNVAPTSTQLAPRI
jgi:hypothetical protein